MISPNVHKIKPQSPTGEGKANVFCPRLQNGTHKKKNPHEHLNLKYPYRFLLWSEQRDLNPRPPSPEPGALPAALCPENTAADWAAVWLGMRESNSHKQSQSLPHYHYANPQYLHFSSVSGLLTKDIIPDRGLVVNCFFKIWGMEFTLPCPAPEDRQFLQKRRQKT